MKTRFFVLLLAALSLSGLSSCTGGSSPGCTIEHGLEPILTSGLAAIGGCKNPAALGAGIEKAAAAIGICSLPPSPSPVPSSLALIFMAKDQTAGPISMICQAVVPGLIAALVPLGNAAVFPAAAQCDPNANVSMLQAGASVLCGMIPAVKPVASPSS